LRFSFFVRGAVVTAAVLIISWVGFAQVSEKTPDKPREKGTSQTKKDAKPPTSEGAPKAIGAPAAEKAEGKPTETAASDAADEAAIRQGAVRFVEAYNAHDAQGISELFAQKAEFTDEAGNLIKGRDAIQKDFAKMFEQFPKSSIKIDIDTIRVLTPNIAVEEGIVRGTPVPEEPENVSSYVAVHVKIEGRWLIASVKDFDVDDEPLTANDHLQELAFLRGEWLEESAETVVNTVCDWHDNGNFLMQEYRVQIEGKVAMSGTMRIGWDGVRKQFRSWVFDSQGGFAQGMWLRNDDEWIVKTEGATAAGEAASATQIYRMIDADTIGWRSIDRVIDGERQEDIPEIVVKRRPPPPQN
jgi:uncharacterized protein (TIGR02246 family)